jgi:hypothetical protein
MFTNLFLSFILQSSYENTGYVNIGPYYVTSGIGNAPPAPRLVGALDLENTKICCGSFQTEFQSSDRRQ